MDSITLSLGGLGQNSIVLSTGQYSDMPGRLTVKIEPQLPNVSNIWITYITKESALELADMLMIMAERIK